jgi:hypothetical protein
MRNASLRMAGTGTIPRDLARSAGDWKMFLGRIPRPKGEGGAKHRVRGAEKILFTRHPAGCKIFTLTHGGPLCIIIRLGA